MAIHTRTQGANARSHEWDHDEQPQRRGNWLPLDTLDEEEIYSGTPKLHAVAAPRRDAGRGSRYRDEVVDTRPQPKQKQRPRVETQEIQAGPVAAGVQARAVAIVAGAALSALALYVMVTAALEWVQIKLDDFQYGRPRTQHLAAYVGHGETEGVPSHFIAMNLNRRVTVVELPGGDGTKATTIVGPYLFGQGEDLTPVGLTSEDLNSDGKADLIVSVKSEQLVYLNDGAAFKLITPEERAALQQSLLSPQSPAGAGTVEEGGK